MAAAAQKVEHSLKNLVFFIRMADNSRSVLEYRKPAEKVMEMYHTEVPKQFAGQGHAKTLVQEAFKYAMANNMLVIPTCSYVAKYAREIASEPEKKIVISGLEQGQ